MPMPAKIRANAPKAVVLAGAALLVLGGCGQAQTEPVPEPIPTATSAEPEAPAPSVPSVPPTLGSSGAEATGAAPAMPSDPTTAMDGTMTQFLQLHLQLKTDLGSAYSDAWIENNQLHVAVTTDQAEAAVAAAGAVPVRAEFTDQELNDAVDGFKAWLGTDTAPQVQVLWLGTSGRTGSITVRVPADQVQLLTDAIAEQRPAGAVKVIVEESTGPATPLGVNAP